MVVDFLSFSEGFTPVGRHLGVVTYLTRAA
jgi:hypothetical protein